MQDADCELQGDFVLAPAEVLLSSEPVMAFKLVIISGAQTGVERAAMEWTVKHQIPHGGWCAARLEEAPNPDFKLKEAETDDVFEVLDSNIRDSDATVVFTAEAKPKLKTTGQKAVTLAKKQKKPVLHVHRGILGVSEKIVAFIDKHYPRRVHITGSTEEDEPGVAYWAIDELEKMKGIMERRPD